MRSALYGVQRRANKMTNFKILNVERRHTTSFRRATPGQYLVTTPKYAKVKMTFYLARFNPKAPFYSQSLIIARIMLPLQDYAGEARPHPKEATQAEN